MKSRVEKAAAFTLIELLIVVAIIAILAAIAVPNFLDAKIRSNVSRTMADMRTIKLAVDTYGVDNNNYPLINPAERTFPTPGGGTGFDQFVFDWLMVVPPQAGRTVPYNGSLLTTPIAYLSSIPPDVFNTQADPVLNDIINGPGDFGTAGVSRQVSVFALFCSFQSQRACYAISPPGSGGAGHYRFDMQLYSMGPDLRWWLTTDWPPGSWHYDPTNGTLSNGDLILSDLGWISPNVGNVGFVFPG